MADQMDFAEEQDDEKDQAAPKPQPAAAPAQQRDVPEAGPTFAAAEPRILDLSKEIVQTVTRAAGERVTCRRISGNHYRCNWWAAQGTNEYDNPEMTGMLVTTHRVIRSQMLRVTKAGGALQIEQAGLQR